ncbi:transcription factor/nuclear export subunit protein 2-domain-containing protein [Clohesyomyces aquaticus]|uniref:THO complex subunit 2 n=1 Tax=Clohesyomyces aquaticus TaxID=1231657 RepID=A0A1Y2A571_9PLEO|nr:transcription factor/nuclear export subunit protein 2-domain-containing protein [Clohesyomyces aquaticus]
MAPGTKRKRGDRNYSYDSNENSSRPSPHRPLQLGLAQTSQQNSNGRGSSRRNSRQSGRGGSSAPQSPTVAQTAPGAMSPPATVPAQTKPTPPANPPSAQASATTDEPMDQSEQPPHPAAANIVLTLERVITWKDGGRKATMEAGIAFLSECNMLMLAVLFEELLQACVDRLLPANELGSTVQDILAHPCSDALEPASIFLDTANTMMESGVQLNSIKPLLEASGVDPQKMRGELETTLLTTLNMVRPTFPRVAIRKTTHALYRQSNYNLLREETEGYSKLITEYFTTVNNEPPKLEVVTDTFERVKALIGAFDLDVGRVLDVTLDVFANLLVKHTKFFVKFLRASSWWPQQEAPHGIEWEEPAVSALPKWAQPNVTNWYYTEEEKDEQLRLREIRDREFWTRVPLSTKSRSDGIKAFFELGARRIVSGQSTLPPKAKSKEDAAFPADMPDFEKTEKWSQQYMAETGALPPPGNRVAAQLLGFKLRFYASDARDVHDTLPDNLIHLAALLIKIGFISLADLYPHLYPLDEDMEALKGKLEAVRQAELDKIKAQSGNALTKAAPLTDDTLPTPAPVARLREADSKIPSKPESERGTPARTEDDTKKNLPEPVDQKTALLRSLLLIGAIPDALYILGLYPWLLTAYPDLQIYIIRLLHHSLSKVYAWTRPASTQNIPTTPKHMPSTGTGAHASSRPSDYPPRRTLRWAKLEERDAGDGIDYRFYWEDWMDNVPICQTVDDVFKLCDSLLGLVGPQIGKDPTLLTKLIRIGKKSLAEDASDNNIERWVILSATLLGPATSFTGANPGVVNELWEFFRFFDTTQRFRIYKNWFTSRSATNNQKEMMAKFLQIKAETFPLLNRISKENVKSLGKAFGKVAHASPGTVFQLAIERFEKYPNFVEVLVESCRFLTYLGYDCLTWALTNSLSQMDRDAAQADGMLTSPWLRNIAEFIGKVCRRYSNMDSVPMLKYFLDQMARGNVHIVVIVEQVVTSMAGIGSYVTLTESQAMGISSGPRLRSFTLEHYLGDQQHLSKASAKRLMKCLKGSGLGPHILIALAQEVFGYQHRSECKNTPEKVIGLILDNLLACFAQFLDLLRNNLTIDEFDSMVPGVVELISDYNVDPALGFAICRASIAAHVNAARNEARSSPLKTKNDQIQNQTNGDVTMGGVEGDVAIKANPPSHSVDVEMEDAPKVEESSTPKEAATPSPLSPRSNSNPVIEALAEQLKPALPDHVCLGFYVTFWELSLRDIHCPMKEYQAATNYYAEKSKAIDTRRDSVQLSKKRDAERALWLEENKAILREVTQFSQTCKHTLKQLQKEMHHWFEGVPMVGTDLLYEKIIQDCFLPRIQLSSEDAQFTSTMLKLMHSSGVPGFRTMKLLDTLFKTSFLVKVLLMSTSRESQNLGRFFHDVLQELATWHSSQDSYTKFATGEKKLPGFGRTFNADRTPATFLDFEDYRRVLYKWHSQFRQALETSLKSDDYMHIRNAINILKAVAPSFPVVDTMGKSLHQLVQNMSRTEPREDLKLAAMSLLGDFKKGENKWVAASSFHIVRAGAAVPTAGVRVASEHPNMPQPADTPPKTLNAAVPAFTPKTVVVNGTSNAVTKTSNEHEDGEVDDEKNKTAIEAAAATARGQPATQHSTPVTSKPTISAPNKDTDSKPRNIRSDTNPSKPISSHGSLPVLIPTRPDSRGPGSHASPSVSASRVPHALPSKPDTRPSAVRPVDRPADHVPDHSTHARHDVRSKATNDFGRLDRPAENSRESFPDRRELSPGRRPRGRTPDRGPNAMDRRDPGWGGRDLRDYHDERSMRPPPRDARVPPPGRGAAWEDLSRDPRDTRDLREPRDPRGPRDPRDPRDRLDSRGPPLAPPLDNRARSHLSTPASVDDVNSYRRDTAPNTPQGGERNGQLPPRPSVERPATNVPAPALDRAPPATGRPLINPERAAFIEGDRGRNDGFRSERDTRRERSRPQSPRRPEERTPASHHSRNEPGRDSRDERINEREMRSRDRREEPTGHAPTGPRGGRNEFTESQMSSRATREMFQPSHGSRGSQAQDPNYGRLKDNVDPPPSGPRSSMPDRRDQPRREQAAYDQAQPPPPPPPPTGPAQPDTSGVHPSRLNHIRGPPIQTDIPGAPSGPRGAARTPHGPGASPSTRTAPTGPASIERNGRGQDKSFARTLNSVFSQGAPAAPGGPAAVNDRGVADRGTSIRGRGSRASGPVEPPNLPSPVGSHSHPGTPITARPEGPPSRVDRPEHPLNKVDNHLPEDGRESRSSRDGRRGERRHRSRSPDRGDRRPDERSSRNDELGPGADRERGSGREKRSGDSSRRDRERDGERSARDGKERRERGSERGGERGGREDGRGSGRGEETNPRRGPASTLVGPPQWTGDVRPELRGGEPRGRNGGERRGDDRDRRGGREDGRDGRGRKRGGDDSTVHGGDMKRPRRSMN